MRAQVEDEIELTEADFLDEHSKSVGVLPEREESPGWLFAVLAGGFLILLSEAWIFIK